MKTKKIRKVCCQSTRLENGRQRFSISGILPMNEESKGRLIFLGTIFILLTILFIGLKALMLKLDMNLYIENV